VNRKSVSFNQLDRRDQQRIRYKKVNAASGDEVTEDDIVKGYEVSKGHYVVVDPDELEQFLPTATRSIDLDEFVSLEEIDPLFLDAAYYVAPDKMVKPYALLVQAMEEAGKVAVGRFVMRNKQYLAAVRAKDGRLVLSTMVYPDELVDPKSIDEFDGLTSVEVSDRELAMAGQLVESLTGPFQPDQFRDEYREQVLALIEQKAAGEEWEAPAPAATATQVVDLMAALEASVQAAKEARGRHPTSRPQSTPQPAEVAEPKRGTRKRKSA
jgi:DNA end-binding protein Ku